VAELHVLGQRAFHEGAKLREPILTQRHAAAMAWPPPFIQYPVFTACRTALPRSTPEIERPEPVRCRRFQRNRKSRPREFFLQPRGNQPDNARMPASEAVPMTAPLSSSPSDASASSRPRLRGLLDDAALAVEPVNELGRDRAASETSPSSSSRTRDLRARSARPR